MIPAWLTELLAAVMLALALRLFVLNIACIRGRSMMPTLHNGDWVLVWRLPYCFRKPARQDVVICHYPGRKHPRFRWIPQSFVKRVIGLPGDTLETVEGQVQLNGASLDEPYLDPARCRLQGNRPARALTEDEYFVMGDNRDSSNDSRRVGPLRRRAVKGRVVCILWPPRRWGRVR